MRIVTKHETFSIDRNGCIGRPKIGMSPSDQWKMQGLVKRNNFGHVVCFVPFDSIACMIGEFQWTYKNGKPVWTVRDLDHGTTREWGSGVLRITL
jgi:hypothetical protein